MSFTTGLPVPVHFPYTDITADTLVQPCLGWADILVEGGDVVLPPVLGLGLGTMAYIRNEFQSRSDVFVSGGGTIDGAPSINIPEVFSVMLVIGPDGWTVWKYMRNGFLPGLAARAAVQPTTTNAGTTTPGGPDEVVSIPASDNFPTMAEVSAAIMTASNVGMPATNIGPAEKPE